MPVRQAGSRHSVGRTEFGEHSTKFSEGSAKFSEHSTKFSEHATKFSEHSTLSEDSTAFDRANAVCRSTQVNAVQQQGVRELAGHKNTQLALAKELSHSHMLPIAKFARGKLRGVPGYAELTFSLDETACKRISSRSSMQSPAAPHRSASGSSAPINWCGVDRAGGSYGTLGLSPGIRGTTTGPVAHASTMRLRSGNANTSAAAAR
jgi:hypothetical protein